MDHRTLTPSIITMNCYQIFVLFYHARGVLRILGELFYGVSTVWTRPVAGTGTHKFILKCNFLV